MWTRWWGKKHLPKLCPDRRDGEQLAYRCIVPMCDFTDVKPVTIVTGKWSLVFLGTFLSEFLPFIKLLSPRFFDLWGGRYSPHLLVDLFVAPQAPMVLELKEEEFRCSSVSSSCVQRRRSALPHRPVPSCFWRAIPKLHMPYNSP